MLLQYGMKFGDFSNSVQYLEQLGFFDVFVPFVLIFAIVYEMLKKAGVLTYKTKDKEGKEVDDNKINGVVAAAIALFAVVPHVMGVYPVGFDIVEIIKAFFPQIALTLVVITIILVLMNVLGFKEDAEHPSYLKKYAMWIAVILVGLFLLMSMYPQAYAWNWLNPDLITALLTGLIAVLIIFWLMR